MFFTLLPPALPQNLSCFCHHSCILTLFLIRGFFSQNYIFIYNFFIMALQRTFSWESNYLKKNKRNKRGVFLVCQLARSQSVLARIHKGIFQANITKLFQQRHIGFKGLQPYKYLSFFRSESFESMQVILPLSPVLAQVSFYCLLCPGNPCEPRQCPASLLAVFSSLPALLRALCTSSCFRRVWKMPQWGSFRTLPSLVSANTSVLVCFTNGKG